MATRTSAAERVSYQDLYARWEQGNWKATDLDFSQDREDWHEKFSDLERRAALWNYAMFFHGEDSVATNLTPYIDAAPREEQKYFLTTQQVDEARHAVFFARFMSEVVNTGDSIAASLTTTQPELSWGFKKVFARLDRMADELRKDRSRPKLAAAVTLYHLIVEASLAQPGQHFIEDYLGERGVLRAAGMPPDELPGGVPLEVDLSSEDRAKRGIAFLRGNILGEKNGPPSQDPELLDEYFDSIRRGLSQAYTGDEPLTLQWDFRDAEPWHLDIANGSSSVARGRLESPDITFRCRFEDWVDVSMGREDARRALARGRVIPRGKPRALWRARSLFQR